MNNFILIPIILSINILFFGVGYLVGKIGKITGVSNIKPRSFFDKEDSPVSNISIDSTKVVTNISTDGLEKKYNTLGNQTESKENITSSIDKLKNMKK